MAKKVIYTINARGHVLLEVMREYFRIGPDVMLREIQAMLAQTEAILASKGIAYSSLKTVLVPSPKRREIALVFDTSEMKEAWYGCAIHTKLMPLFSKDSNHSVLVGDYIGEKAQQDNLFEALSESLVLAREVTYKHSSQFYIVYINNLSDRMFESFDEGLRGFPPYAGFADLTFSSFLKFYLSSILVNSFIKRGRVVLMGHEDDRDNSEDINIVGYPFQEFGYTCRSLQSDLFGVLLSYKIERPVVKGYETDTEFSINAVNPVPMPLSEFDIQIDENKFKYLAEEKEGSLKRAGLIDGGLDELRRVIRKTISSNYIYNMSHDDEHDTTKFDIILEINASDTGSRFRLMAAMEYIPKARVLRLITMH